MALKWYVVHTYSGHENKARLALLERIKQESMDTEFGQVLIPTESVLEMVRASAARPPASSIPAICSFRWRSTNGPTISSKTQPDHGLSGWDNADSSERKGHRADQFADV